MTLHPTTFDYLQPSQEQIENMKQVREGATVYARLLQQLLPDGPDKTYVLRKLREVGMWANVCITRQADGSPRA